LYSFSFIKSFVKRFKESYQSCFRSAVFGNSRAVNHQIRSI